MFQVPFHHFLVTLKYIFVSWTRALFWYCKHLYAAIFLLFLSCFVFEYFRHLIQYSGCGLELKMEIQCLTGSIYWFFIRTGVHSKLKQQMIYFVHLVLHPASWKSNFHWNSHRIKTNPKSAINEHFLPRFLDFVVWGHEHECLVDPQVTASGFRFFTFHDWRETNCVFVF